MDSSARRFPCCCAAAQLGPTPCSLRGLAPGEAWRARIPWRVTRSGRAATNAFMRCWPVLHVHSGSGWRHGSCSTACDAAASASASSSSRLVLWPAGRCRRRRSRPPRRPRRPRRRRPVVIAGPAVAAFAADLGLAAPPGAGAGSVTVAAACSAAPATTASSGAGSAAGASAANLGMAAPQGAAAAIAATLVVVAGGVVSDRWISPLRAWLVSAMPCEPSAGMPPGRRGSCWLAAGRMLWSFAKSPPLPRTRLGASPVTSVGASCM